MTREQLNAIRARVESKYGIGDTFGVQMRHDTNALLAEVERLNALVRQNGGSVHESVEGFVERMRRERDNAIEQNGRAATVAIRERESKVAQNVALIGQNGRLQQEVERLRDAHAMAVQVSGELCEKCGWAMKFPGEKCRCELLAEVERLRESCTGLVKMNERQYDEVLRLTAEVEAKVAQNVALIGQNGRLQQEVERLTADPLPAAAWVREVERAAFARGVAAMREAAASHFSVVAPYDYIAPRIRALPDPEDR